MDRVERRAVPVAPHALDAIEVDLDRLEAALDAGSIEFPEPTATDLLQTPMPVPWTDEQRTRAQHLLDRNMRLRTRIADRMRSTTQARLLLGTSPTPARYLDTTA